jgi:hypothetical protein
VFRVDARGRFVEEEDLGPVHDCLGQERPAAKPGRQVPKRNVGSIVKPDRRHRRCHGRRPLFA